MQNTDTKNLFIAMGLSALVIFAWQYFFAVPQLASDQEISTPTSLPPSNQQDLIASLPGVIGEKPRDEILTEAPRVEIDAPSLRGSINLRGARLDDLVLAKYFVDESDEGPNVVLFSPAASFEGYFAEHGWIANNALELNLPTQDSVWQPITNNSLAPGSPVVLEYDSGAGLVITRTIKLDDSYMFEISDTIANRTGADQQLYHYGMIARNHTPVVSGYFILHEGPIGYLDGSLRELDYDEIAEDKVEIYNSDGGWIGFTDKYWASALILSDEQEEARFRANPSLTNDFNYRVYSRSPALSIADGASATKTTSFFAGAKEVKALEQYQDQGVQRFDLMIDWGWFYYLTFYMFQLIDFFNHQIGNFGLAILASTVVVKLLFYPLASKSYDSISKMKLVQPEVVKIREQYADDRVKQQQMMLDLYRKNKINPLAGFLPMFLQIPVFFSLYKVLFVTIEMRHAPFFGWITDLAAPDPTNLFNLFGLIPIELPSLLHIGIWPLLMGITMMAQMRLNPPPTDPIQAKIFAWMPVLFTFMLANFPAGLVIYWTWNNTLSILQQSLIMRKNKVPNELVGMVKRVFGSRKDGLSHKDS